MPLAAALDDFHVVVPSIPGFVFSAPLRQPYRPAAVAELWHRLMTEQLGYERYLTYGEDVGAGVRDWLAASHPESVMGVHATHAVFTPPARREGQTVHESEFFDWLATKWKRASGYASIQSTRPHTLAVALSDSPVGLAAWIIEMLDAWSEVPFSLDDELTTVMLYWISGCIGTSFRPYVDDEHDTALLPVIPPPSGCRRGRASIPARWPNATTRTCARSTTCRGADTSRPRNRQT